MAEAPAAWGDLRQCPPSSKLEKSDGCQVQGQILNTLRVLNNLFWLMFKI